MDKNWGPVKPEDVEVQAIRRQVTIYRGLYNPDLMVAWWQDDADLLDPTISVSMADVDPEKPYVIDLSLPEARILIHALTEALDELG